jgi:hypothetical protein
MVRGLMVSCGVVVLAAVVSVASPAQQPSAAAQPAAAQSKDTAKAPKKKKPSKREREFQALAPALNTTPEALDAQYKTAQAADPYLKRGTFVTALMVARDLGPKNPKVTSDALLAGLKGGASLQQTLQDLGLSAADATKAERAARQEAKAIEKPAP